jgi:hypothetical protein
MPSPKKPKTIPELFVARDKAVSKATKNIFAAMPGAIEAINELMGLEDIQKSGGDLHWEDIDLVGDEAENLLVMVGVVVFPAGCELEAEGGGIIKVTKDTEPYFRRLVRAGLPASVAVQGKDEVVAYFKKMQEDYDNQLDVAGLDNLLERETEFDLSALTEEQRRAYETSMMVKPGKA